MKLSTLLVLFAAASTCIAQNTAKSPAASALPPHSFDSNSVTVVTMGRDSEALPQISKEELAHRIEQMQKMADRACPVVLTSANLTPHLLLLRAGGDAGKDGGLDLEFRNASGKSIFSMELAVQILAKKSIYDLAATRIHLDLTAYGARSADETFAQLRHLALPEGMNPSIVESVTLKQVFYEDGTVWTAKNDSFCGLGSDRMLSIAR
jgi:hypothetical protein